MTFILFPFPVTPHTSSSPNSIRSKPTHIKPSYLLLLLAAPIMSDVMLSVSRSQHLSPPSLSLFTFPVSFFLHPFLLLTSTLLTYLVSFVCVCSWCYFTCLGHWPNAQHPPPQSPSTACWKANWGYSYPWTLGQVLDTTQCHAS
ncbi:hypothetical protein BsWGS_28371 [Bradybaena similaris]